MDALRNVILLQLVAITMYKINTWMDYVYFSKQEILEKETGEQSFWLKNIIANHHVLKPSDQAYKGILPNPIVNWEMAVKLIVSPTLLVFLTLLEKISSSLLYSMLKEISLS